MVKLKLPDGSESNVRGGMSCLEAAKGISAGLARAALAAKIDGKLVDLGSKIERDCRFEVITFKSKEGKEVEKYLIINRIDPNMVADGEMLAAEDILEILGIELLGMVPEDKGVIDASNQGQPIILNEKSAAGRAYKRIAKRLCGERVPIQEPKPNPKGVVSKLKGIFS